MDEFWKIAVLAQRQAQASAKAYECCSEEKQELCPSATPSQIARSRDDKALDEYLLRLNFKDDVVRDLVAGCAEASKRGKE